MHSSHTKTGKCENGTENATWYGYTKFHDNFRSGPSEMEIINCIFIVNFGFFYWKITYEEETPRSSRYTEALSLKLLYACSRPVSSVFSSTINTIIATSKYTKPVTMHVERSPIDSSLLKYCTVSEMSSLLENTNQLESTWNWFCGFECNGIVHQLTMQKIWLKDTTSCSNWPPLSMEYSSGKFRKWHKWCRHINWNRPAIDIPCSSAD